MQLYVSSLNISLTISLNCIGRNAMYFQSVKILWNKLFSKKTSTSAKAICYSHEALIEKAIQGGRLSRITRVRRIEC